MTTTMIASALPSERLDLFPPRMVNGALPEDLSFALMQYRELRSIGCEYKHGTLILLGTVSSYYLKQLCQEALRSTAAELNATIDNRLQVFGS